MEKVVFLAVVLAVVLTQIVCSEEFYVKPTLPKTECPSGNSQCHSLQYYADHNNFTNNSRFLFLEGEHHLNSVVDIKYLSNLSLVGVTSGVKILCKSVPSGFQIEDFIGLNFENLAVLNCGEDHNASVFLVNGSEVSFNNVSITGASQTGLMAINVLGSFNVTNSFFMHEDVNVQVSYFLCNAPSQFKFSNNELSVESKGLEFVNNCSDVAMHIAHSNFSAGSNRDEVWGLYMEHHSSLNNSLLVEKSTFTAAIYSFSNYTCGTNDNFRCSKDFMTFTGNTIHSSAEFAIKLSPTNHSSIIIKDSKFSDMELMGLYLHPVPVSDVVDTFETAILDNVTFVNNSAVIKLVGVQILLIDCKFRNNTSSAITADDSSLIFRGNSVFQNNSALFGGGIQLHSSSKLNLEPHSHILFEMNHAYYGGAIYYQHACFFDKAPSTAQVDFVGNTAWKAGSSLYGNIELCCSSRTICKHYFSNVFNVTNTEVDPSAISSDPDKVCLCEDRQPNCSNRAYSTEAYPSKSFPVPLSVVSSGYDSLGAEYAGVVPGTIHAYTSLGTVEPYQVSQDSDQTCKDFHYIVHGTETAKFRLGLEQSTASDDSIVLITVHLKDCCPIGFALSDVGECECQGNDNECYSCNIDDGTFSTIDSFACWLGFVNESSNVSGVFYVVLVYFPLCPSGYCTEVANFTLNNSDDQCTSNRIGILCGKCLEGYSLTLGKGLCEECSNTYLLLLFPLTLSGLFLVVILFALNLTVTEGTINGLIFYANVLYMSNMVSKDAWFYPFLAWLNLDLGITTCFYDGMDAYSEIWLEFLFPAYLFAIILAIIKFYEKFPTLAHRVGGENVVKVIATPLLLFYTKLQRIVVTIFSFARLEYPDGGVRYVWLYDGNVDFFSGKHLYLGIAGILVLFFIIVPYSLCLTFFQQLQACSGQRMFRWVNKFKPVFDCYAGPYKDKYRFWTGMLLIVRTLLIISFAASSGDVIIICLIIAVVSCALLIAQSNGIYKKWPCNCLESFFYAQLIIFAHLSIYYPYTFVITPDISLGLTLFIFLVVLGYHVVNRIASIIKKYSYHHKGYVNIDEDIPHSREIN